MLKKKDQYFNADRLKGGIGIPLKSRSLKNNEDNILKSSKLKSLMQTMKNRLSMVKSAGEAIRLLRHDANYSVKKIASDCHLSFSYLCKIERGEKPVTPDVIDKLYSCLECSDIEYQYLYRIASLDYLESKGWNRDLLSICFCFDSAFDMSFGDILKDYRYQNNISAVDFAMDLDISSTYLSKLENNKVRPSIKLVDKLSAHLGLNSIRLYELALRNDYS